jgi:hypothetical protein
MDGIKVRVYCGSIAYGVNVPANCDVDLDVNARTGAVQPEFRARATVVDINNYLTYVDRTGDRDVTVGCARDTISRLLDTGFTVWGKRVSSALARRYLDYLNGFDADELIKNVVYSTEPVE